MGRGAVPEGMFIAARIDLARAGQIDALYELGVAFSVGRHGVEIDLVQAHKYFNLAAAKGDDRAAADRAEIAADMTRDEIAAAQRDARAWLMAA